MLITRQTCRICSNPNLKSVLSLGDQYLASYFANERFASMNRKIPLELVRCDTTKCETGCGLVQLKHTVPADFMYSAYGYKSGINEAMSKHLGDLARQVEDMVKPGANDIIVDVGANDGTLVKSYKTKEALKVGFEPSNVAPKDSELPSDIKYIRNYFNQGSFNSAFPGRKAKIITSIAMFYDLEKPHNFVADGAALLEKDGVWVIELCHLGMMLRQNNYDTICHEHLEYYHMAPMEHLLGAHGLKIFDVSENDANGGSFRVFVCHQGSKWDSRNSEGYYRVLQFKKTEFEEGLDQDQVFEHFKTRTEKTRTELQKLLKDLAAQGKTVCGYGASTKGNVILQYCGIDSRMVKAIAERNPAKYGTKTLGSNIPILPEADVHAMKPDYLLILPWHFLNGFMKREEEFLKRGGKLIVPLPEVKVIGG